MDQIEQTIACGIQKSCISAKFSQNMTNSEMAGHDKKLVNSINQKLKERGEGEKSEDFLKLLEYGLDKKVAAKIDDIYKMGKFSHSELDQRAIHELKKFSVDDALKVLDEFMRLNLDYITNKAAYLSGVMKMYKKNSRAYWYGSSRPVITAPANGYEDRIKKIIEKTGYPLEVTAGQRKYGPPPNWDGPNPGKGCEIFCGKIPTDIFEDELIPLFEKCGKIFDFRLMMDPLKGKNRGFAFISFTSPKEALNAVQQLNNYEIKPGKLLEIKITIPNLRLFVGNIPKLIGKIEILIEFAKLTCGLVDVIIYGSPDGTLKNRGFCFLEYYTHKAAAVAKRLLEKGGTKLWGCDIFVDWADPQEEPDEQTMSTVKNLYVKNLTQEVTENDLKNIFEKYGKLERVKKMKDYAFIHFEKRDNALKAMGELNGKQLRSTFIKVSLAKPPTDKKKTEEILRARERRRKHVFHAQKNVVGRAICANPNMISSISPQRELHEHVCPKPLCSPKPLNYHDNHDGTYYYDAFRGNYDHRYCFGHPSTGVRPATVCDWCRAQAVRRGPAVDLCGNEYRPRAIQGARKVLPAMEKQCEADMQPEKATTDEAPDEKKSDEHNLPPTNEIQGKHDGTLSTSDSNEISRDRESLISK